MEYISRYNDGTTEYQIRDPVGVKSWYGTCDTVSDTAIKIVTTINGDFELRQGSTCKILFQYENTNTSGILLNIDGTGEHSLLSSGQVGNQQLYWLSGQVIEVLYDGTQFQIIGQPDAILKIYRNATGIAGTSSSPYRSAKWDVTDSSVTSYVDGMVVIIKLPVASVATGGAVFQINSLGYKPVVFNINSGVSSRYGLGSVVICTYNATQTAIAYFDSSSATTVTGCWQIMDYNVDTIVGYGITDYYAGYHAGSALYRYKLCMQGLNGELYPIVTTNQTSNTQVVKAVQTAGLRPYNIWYYNGTTDIAKDGLIAHAVMWSNGYLAYTAQYTFNSSIATYKMVYLCGSYDIETDLFYLDQTDANSYYVQVPNDTASITLSDYFIEGKYYLLVGASYTSNNYMKLFGYNPFYYFDGTNLIPYSTQVTNEAKPQVVLNETTQMYKLVI